MQWIKKHPVISFLIAIIVIVLGIFVSAINTSVQKDVSLIDTINIDVLPNIHSLEEQFNAFAQMTDSQKFDQALIALTSIQENMSTLRDSIPSYDGDDINLQEGVTKLSQGLTILDEALPAMKEIIEKGANKTLQNSDQAKLAPILAQRGEAGKLLDQAGTAFESYGK